MRGAFSVVLVVVLGGLAAADTGASIQGESWSAESTSSSSSSSSSGGYDYSPSSSGHDYSSSGSSSSGSGAGAIKGGEVMSLLMIFGGMIALAARSEKRKRLRLHGGTGAEPAAVDVTVLRFALDARTRPFVQKELDRIAKSADVRTPDGMATTLREIALLLRRLRDGWVYGGAHNFAMTGKGAARSSFEHHASHARGLYRRELIRNQGGTITTTETRELPRRSEEGEGLVLVTLVVAARLELFTVGKVGDGDGLRQALEVLSSLTAQTLVAMEVIWMPADPEDRMSSVELEALLRDEIFPIQGAMVGKVICGYCGGPFPRELLSCPHCGGRAAVAA